MYVDICIDNIHTYHFKTPGTSLQMFAICQLTLIQLRWVTYSGMVTVQCARPNLYVAENCSIARIPSHCAVLNQTIDLPVQPWSRPEVVGLSRLANSSTLRAFSGDVWPFGLSPHNERTQRPAESRSKA